MTTTDTDLLPDWYLASALRGIASCIRYANLTDDQVVRMWHAYLAAAPHEHLDE